MKDSFQIRFKPRSPPHMLKVGKGKFTCIVFDQVFDDFEVSIEASCSQGGRVGLGRRVHVGPTLHQ